MNQPLTLQGCACNVPAMNLSTFTVKFRANATSPEFLHTTLQAKNHEEAGAAFRARFPGAYGVLITDEEGSWG
jgi:hypothetical protein